MALFKILKGTRTNLDAVDNAGNLKVPIHEGYCYFTTDEHQMWIDVDNNTRVCLNAEHADSASRLGQFTVGDITTPIYLNNGLPNLCSSLLPLSAGENNKITGPLGLTKNIMYGSSLESIDSFEGRLFFLEDNEIIEEDEPSLPIGGTAGQILVKNSSVDGDASWKDFPSLNYLSLNGGTVNGSITALGGFIGNLSGKAASADSAINATNATNATNAEKIYSSASTTKAYVLGTTTASYGNHATVYNSSVYTEGTVLYGAAWNDYAEYRNQKEKIEPGYCIASTDDGRVYKTTEKYQACDGIVSDTFGFAIGETDQCKTPIAVAGRVLAYCQGNKNDYHSGDTVCAGPDGKVMKMTREEVCKWPDRIIGIVSEIPTYEVWGTENIIVNDRIWIKIK